MLKSFNNGVGGVSGTMPGGGRRRANYRQPPHPHRCHVQRTPIQLDTSSSNIGSTTEPRKKLKLLPSPIRKYQTQTTFAAAIAAPAPRKKHRVHRMSSPLLGAAGPPHHIKRKRLGSFRDSVSNSLSTKNLALPSNCSSPAAASRTIQKNMSTSLARVSSKINMKRGRKSTSPKQDENHASSEEAPQLGSENTSPSLNNNSSTLQHGTVVDDDAKEQDMAVGHFISLEPDSNWSTPVSFDDADITNHFRGLDSGEVGTTQHDTHMTERSTPSPLFTEGFSLQLALSPVASLCLEEVEEEEVMSHGGVVEVCKPVPVSKSVPTPLDDDQENTECPPKDQEDWSNSSLSLPSLSGEACEEASNDVTASLPQARTNTTKDAADSTLAFGCLSFLLSAPAPKSVLILDNKKQKKKTPVNLWLDDNDDEDMADIIPSLPQDEVISKEEEKRMEFDKILEQVMARRDEGEKSTPSQFYKSYSVVIKEIDTAPPVMPNLSQDDVATNEVSIMKRDESCHSIPSLSSSCVDEMPTMNDDDIALEEPLIETSNDNAADSALAWGCLAAVLASPAPKSMLLDNKKRVPVNLWQDGEGTDENLEDIMTLPKGNYDELVDELEVLNLSAEQDATDASDNCSIPSVSSQDHLGKDSFLKTPAKSSTDEDSDPFSPSSVTRINFREDKVEDPDLLPVDLRELFDDEDDTTEVMATNQKEEGNSVLAWSALTMILGSPAPASVSKSRKKLSPGAATYLFEGKEVLRDNDTIPNIDPDEVDKKLQLVPVMAQKWQCNGGKEDDDSSIPSLSGLPSLSDSIDTEDDDLSPLTQDMSTCFISPDRNRS